MPATQLNLHKGWAFVKGCKHPAAQASIANFGQAVDLVRSRLPAGPAQERLIARMAAAGVEPTSTAPPARRPSGPGRHPWPGQLRPACSHRWGWLALKPVLPSPPLRLIPSPPLPSSLPTWPPPASATPTRPVWNMWIGAAGVAMWSPHPAATPPATKALLHLATTQTGGLHQSPLTPSAMPKIDCFEHFWQCGGQLFGPSHAACAYSWISPPSRSRRTTLPAGTATADSTDSSGGAWPKARCGRWTL